MPGKNAQSVDDFLNLAETCRLLPGRPSGNTAKRWMFTGINGVKLQFIRAGRRIYTTPEFIERFLAAQNTDAPAKPSKQTRAHAVAEAKLDALGI